MNLLLAVQHIADPVLPAVYVAVGLALLGAVLGGQLLTPIMRLARSFAVAVDPPEWGRAQLSFPAWKLYFLHLNLILPAVATVIWVSLSMQTSIGHV